nr:HNH endonuclease [uncultured Flavobacterium sp.]
MTPNQEAKDFHYKKISEVFNKIIEEKYIKRDDKPVYLPNCFLKFLSDNFEELISAEPNSLLEIHLKYNKLVFSVNERENIKSFFLQTGYKNFQNNYGKEFLNLLRIDTCVYCNRNYTLQFDIETNHARAELDHWFPKSEFPVLALSFYNLIPSCHSCNHIKGASKGYDWLKVLEDQNHPYFDKNEFLFSYDYKTYNDFRVKVKVGKDSKTDKTLVFNKTKEIYNAHSDKELKNLLDLRFKYSKNYLDILLNKTFTELSMSKEEAYRMIFGIETKEEDYHKRPFSKFKHDIIEELKNIK